jgi:hypothetical protein
VIISLCRNPDGLLWAGDTAQTISIGSTFTFKQLGASVYRYQVCQSVTLPNNVEQSSRDQFKPCAGRLVNPRVFSCLQTIAPMAVLSNVQTPSSSCCSDFRAQSTSYDQRQESSERSCPSFSMARAFLKVASSFFRHRERALSPSECTRIANLDQQWAACEAWAQPMYATPVSFVRTSRK